MLKFYYSVIFLVFVLNVSKSSALTYNIDIKRYSAFPIISKTLGAAKDFYLSAALYVDENGNIGAILEAENAGDTNTAFYHSMITFKNGFPVATQPGEKAVFNISSFMSNPTITKFNELYYVLFGNNRTKMNVAVTSNPKDSNEWINTAVSTIDNTTLHGAPLFATTENGLQKNYLFSSRLDSLHIYGSTSPLSDISTWTYEQNVFDFSYVQSGNPPLQLKTGDFLYVYNCYVESPPTWSLGYVVTDKTNPFNVVQRSQVSILTPKLDWEIDDSISAVYLTGLLHDKINCLEENDWTQCFFGLYSGAGNHIGAIKIIVSWQ